MEIGQKIKKIRELRNFSQQHVATKLEITQQTYSKMETGEIDFPVSRLHKLAEVLEIKPEEFFIFDEKAMFNNHYWSFQDNAVGIQQQGIAENERKQYESRILDLKEENKRLHNLLEKALTK
ncbi:MAG: XRE family transcriptional regulator [Cytophagia bacterium]|nr:MAG: XRE family transcriptional regulator [Cytophagia bacterium]TAG40826.1 MAG: XRE family transcriptional regulator [Cytophagia bacterium]TAH28557.1 MAG: XRE family transcriptional regulator [Cytophagales bacterium]